MFKNMFITEDSLKPTLTLRRCLVLNAKCQSSGSTAWLLSNYPSFAHSYLFGSGVISQSEAGWTQGSATRELGLGAICLGSKGKSVMSDFHNQVKIWSFSPRYAFYLFLLNMFLALAFGRKYNNLQMGPRSKPDLQPCF